MSQVIRAPEPRRFTRAEYEALVERGFFANENIELLDGAILTMSPQSSRHAGAVQWFIEAIAAALQGAFLVRDEKPIRLDDTSEPEPDIAVCGPDPAKYFGGHPTSGQVLLVIEVAESSLAFDRGPDTHLLDREPPGAPCGGPERA